MIMEVFMGCDLTEVRGPVLSVLGYFVDSIGLIRIKIVSVPFL